MRIALCLEYDGSNFNGWQCQPSQVRTVQGTIELALSKIADSKIETICAGRTDKGVHALNQIIHFDTMVERPDKAWVFGTNSYLPKDVVVKWSKRVNEDFHARFSAISRHYRYYLHDHPIRPAVDRTYLGWNICPLDECSMHQAAQFLLGEHNFSSFRGSNCQSNSPFRQVFDVQVKRLGNQVVIDIIANAFLHHMVRNIVGVLIPIGEGKKPIQWAREVLEAEDRTSAGITASPAGLYLIDVNYPDHLSPYGSSVVT